jgi:transcriptional regulator with XRE-family HTH domain
MATNPQDKMTVANFVAQHVASSGKLQKDIAKEVGFASANMITLIKQGKSQVPKDKIALLARALGVDAKEFLRMVMKEYYPENAMIIDSIVDQPALTEFEKDLVYAMRDENLGIKRLSFDQVTAIVQFALKQTT